MSWPAPSEKRFYNIRPWQQSHRGSNSTSRIDLAVPVAGEYLHCLCRR
nr:MAG TPA: hypothetical protein [Riboviria sp.]